MMSAKIFIVVLITLLLVSPSFTKSIPVKPGGFSGVLKNKVGKGLAKFVKDILEQVATDWFDKTVDEFINGHSSENSKPVAPRSSGVYEIIFAIGNQNVSAVIDISSGLIWTQCEPCDPCLYPPIHNMYDPNSSPTFSNFTSQRCSSNSFYDSSVCQVIKPDLCPDGCEYFTSYSDDQNSTGYVGTDTFTLGLSSFQDILFGCGTSNYGNYENTSGVFALGKGPLSFVSQLGYMRFSYCLSSDATKESPINFGSYAKLHGRGQSTKLIANDKLVDLYYIGLVDITVGNTRLYIPRSTFALQADGSGGVVLTTAFPVTYLEQAAYVMVRRAIISQVNLPIVSGSYLGLDLCFQTYGKYYWPTLTLHFADGASLTPDFWNYMLNDSINDIKCLTILPSSGISVLGSFIQMDVNFVYDIENSTISFENFKCSGWSTLPAHLVTTILIFLCVFTFFDT